MFLVACDNSEKIEVKNYYHVEDTFCKSFYRLGNGLAIRLSNCDNKKIYVLSTFSVTKKTQMVYTTRENNYYYEIPGNYKCIVKVKE